MAIVHVGTLWLRVKGKGTRREFIERLMGQIEKQVRQVVARYIEEALEEEVDGLGDEPALDQGVRRRPTEEFRGRAHTEQLRARDGAIGAAVAGIACRCSAAGRSGGRDLGHVDATHRRGENRSFGPSAAGQTDSQHACLGGARGLAWIRPPGSRSLGAGAWRGRSELGSLADSDVATRDLA